MSQVIEQLMQGNGVRSKGNAAKEAANRIGCDPNLIQAIFDVESPNGPFDGQGRLPLLPEKHRFWRNLPASKRGVAERRNLAHHGWRPKSQYKGLGGVGSDSRWHRMQAMAQIDETAALKSASWAGPQILGENYRICGYETVQQFLLAMAEHEDNQIEAFCRFIEARGLADELRTFDVRAVVRVYNGPGQVDRYTGKVAVQYRKLTGKPLPGVQDNVRTSGLRLGSRGYDVTALQERLTDLGYAVRVDGDFGENTRRQVRAFQADHGLTPDGIVGPKTNEALKTAAPIIAPEREFAEPKDLKDDSRIVKKSRKLKQGAWWTAIVTFFTGIAESVSSFFSGAAQKVTTVDGAQELLDKGYQVKGVLSAVRDFLGPIIDYWWIILLVGLLYVWRQSRDIEDARTEDHNLNKTV